MNRPAAEFVAEVAGLDAAMLGAGALDAAVRACAVELGTDESGLVARLRIDPAAAGAFLSRLLVHETWLFRDRVPFEMLGTLSSCRTREGRLPMRVLSFPCATGEEPWSIAATLLDSGLAPRDFRVLACDLEPRTLAVAERGIYPRRAFRGNDDLSAARRFLRVTREGEDDGVALPSEVRASVEFRCMNLLDVCSLAGEGPFDAIFCRNALVYMSPAARRRVIEVLRSLLAPGGVIVVGHSEVPSLLSAGLRPWGPPGAFAVSAGTDPATATVADGRAAVPHPAARPRPSTDAADDPRYAAAPATRTRSSIVPPAAAPLDEARRLADAGRVADAEHLVRAHLERHPASAEAHLLLGVLLVAARREGEARAAFERAIYLDPSCEEALLHLAALAERAGDLPAAKRLRARASRREVPT